MVLFLVGLGLGSEKDVTVRGLEAIKSCSKVFLEAYTAVLGVDAKKLVSETQQGQSTQHRLSASSFSQTHCVTI